MKRPDDLHRRMQEPEKRLPRLRTASLRIAVDLDYNAVTGVPKSFNREREELLTTRAHASNGSHSRPSSLSVDWSPPVNRQDL